jgi:hypothetical protein
VNLPVYDIIGLLGWWRQSLEPPAFAGRTLAAVASFG